MENSTPNPNGMMNGMPPEVKVEKNIGPIFGVLIIVLVLIIGALYFFGQRLNTTPVIENDIVNIETMPVGTIETSDDTQTLEAELQAELSDIEYSF